MEAGQIQGSSSSGYDASGTEAVHYAAYGYVYDTTTQQYVYNPTAAAQITAQQTPDAASTTTTTETAQTPAQGYSGYTPPPNPYPMDSAEHEQYERFIKQQTEYYEKQQMAMMAAQGVDQQAATQAYLTTQQYQQVTQEQQYQQTTQEPQQYQQTQQYQQAQQYQHTAAQPTSQQYPLGNDQTQQISNQQTQQEYPSEQPPTQAAAQHSYVTTANYSDNYGQGSQPQHELSQQTAQQYNQENNSQQSYPSNQSQSYQQTQQQYCDQNYVQSQPQNSVQSQPQNSGQPDPGHRHQMQQWPQQHSHEPHGPQQSNAHEPQPNKTIPQFNGRRQQQIRGGRSQRSRGQSKWDQRSPQNKWGPNRWEQNRWQQDRRQWRKQEQEQPDHFQQRRNLDASAHTPHPPPPPRPPHTLLNGAEIPRVPATPSQEEGKFALVDSPVKLPTWAQVQYSSVDRFARIGQELRDFERHVTPTRHEQSLRIEVVSRIQMLVRKLCGNGRYAPQVIRFGSFDTGLCLPTSDVDVVVMESFDRVSTQVECQRKLAPYFDYLKNSFRAERVEFISRASVPVVKFVDRQSGLPVDISYGQPSALQTTTLLKDFTHKYAKLRPLALFLKFLLRCNHLNDTYSGGIGSFLLYLLVVNFIQIKVLRSWSVGQCLVEFCTYYADEFDFKRHGVSVRGAGLIFEKKSRGQPEYETLCIENPAQTNHRFEPKYFGANCTRLTQVRNLLRKTRAHLMGEKEGDDLTKNMTLLGALVSNHDPRKEIPPPPKASVTKEESPNERTDDKKDDGNPTQMKRKAPEGERQDAQNAEHDTQTETSADKPVDGAAEQKEQDLHKDQLSESNDGEPAQKKQKTEATSVDDSNLDVLSGGEV